MITAGSDFVISKKVTQLIYAFDNCYLSHFFSKKFELFSKKALQNDRLAFRHKIQSDCIFI